MAATIADSAASFRYQGEPNADYLLVCGLGEARNVWLRSASSGGFACQSIAAWGTFLTAAAAVSSWPRHR
jgi:hypothetical protein